MSAVTLRMLDDGRWLAHVDATWPGFAGHFPGNPILPAAELIDAAARIAAARAWRWDTLTRARFTRPVSPGEMLTITTDERGAALVVRVDSASGPAAKMTLSRTDT